MDGVHPTAIEERTLKESVRSVTDWGMEISVVPLTTIDRMYPSNVGFGG